MKINFKEIELKRYPNLTKIKVDQEVIALKNNYYEKLEGYITEIRYGEDRETENEEILEIIVDFYPSSNMANTHSQLNGTSIDSVIMSELELGFIFEDLHDEIYFDIEGRIICDCCYEPLDRVTETQYDYIEWRFEDGKYIKEEPAGDTNFPRCPLCNARIYDENQNILSY